MKLAWRESEYPCGNCGREFPGTQLDRRMWCRECRNEVIRRSAWIARAVAFLTALGLGFWIIMLVGTSPRFLMIYVVMVVAAYFFVYKLTQRVAFEVIRGRGVPPPTSSDDG